MKKTKLEKKLIAYIEKDEDDVYIGTIPSTPNCHAQGKTVEKMLKNLNEVALLCLRNLNTKNSIISDFVGVQKLNLSHA